MQEHTVKAFDEDITRLRGLIAEMGGLSEAAIAQSLEALIKGDDELADRVVKGDKKIDALESEIDKLAVRIIALRAPMADDLREVIAALKIVADGVNALRSPERAFLVITHYQRLLDYIVPDVVHVMFDGRIVHSGDKELAKELESKGYDWVKEAFATASA